MASPVLTPSLAIVQPRGTALFIASGGSGTGYSFAITTNESGGTIDPVTGLYRAGANAVTNDVVTVTDSLAATATASVSVQGGVYQDYQAGLAPPRLQQSNSGALEAQFGAEKDVQFDRARQGVLSNMPGAGAPDALDYIGQERNLPRATTESPPDNGGPNDTAYAERLRTAWTDIHGPSVAGSHGSLLRALARAGFPMGDPAGAHIIQRIKRYSWLTGDTVTFGTHPTWTFDSSPPAIWNQFGILFGADVPGLSAGTPMADQLNDLVFEWKPAKARFMGTWVVVTPPVWGWPIGTLWGAVGLNWGASASRYIPPT